ncbi:hypothetical protein [Priestia megaterium]|uniref:hypothetical protein n=1 Tax=Priestia megaterium TaxID=1404 RepID=UPI000CA09D8D|nr:hypothetical protein [Priestia megaterium]AUO14772.1 hypothetical protein C0569_26150 [Priestia megaterium]
MQETLDFNEVFQFMKKFSVDYVNRFGEMIIDHKTNIYLPLSECKDLADIETWSVFVLCRPIGKGLEDKDAKRLLKRVNAYFETKLTQEDMRAMYGELCYREKLGEFKDFIKRGFPMNELKGEI